MTDIVVQAYRMNEKRPYSVPEGYFASLESRLCEIPGSVSRRPFKMPRFAVPCMALASACVAAVIVGSMFFGRAVPAGGNASEDEIIEYLIDSGVTLAQLEETVNY